MAKEARARTRSRPTPTTTTRTTRRDTGEKVSEHTNDRQEEINRLPAIQGNGYIRVGGKITENQGDFNSVSVNVEVEMPCAPDFESLEDMYEKVSDFVSDKLEEELDIATGGDGNSG